jgi:GT2 family glycosyltransferase
MADSSPVCLVLLLGEHLHIVACRDGRQPSAIRIDGILPRHRIEAEIGNWQLTFLRNPGAGTELGLEMWRDSVAVEPDAMPGSLESLMATMQLDQAGKAQLLAFVLMQVIPTFQLAADPGLPDAIVKCIAKGRLLAGSATLASVKGLSLAGLVVPAGCAPGVGDSILVVGSACNFGQVKAVRDAIGADAGPIREAALSLDTPPADARLVILSRPQGLICLSLSSDEFVGFESLALEYARHGSALPSLLVLHAPAELLCDVNAALSRSQQGAQMAHAGACDFALSIDVMLCLPAGTFVSGWMLDPDHCLAEAHLLDHSLHDPDLGRQWQTCRGLLPVRDSHRVVTTFCAFVRRVDGACHLPQTPLLIRLGNGEHHVALPAALSPDPLRQRSALIEAVSSSMLSGDGFAKVFAPAMAGIAAAIAPRLGLAAVRHFGKPSWRRASIIVPLYRELGFLRAQLFAFTVDAFVREQCEIIYVLDDPALESQVANILGGFNQLAALDLVLAVMRENGGYAQANNLAAGIAHGSRLVLMNSDVVPEASGWLEPCLEKLDVLPEFSVVGPKLVYGDESLQHAGMYFYRLPDGHWQNMHYFKGYGRNFVAASRSREVPAVTGAVMVLKRDHFHAVGGFSTDYVIGDYEDSDLCLKLGERGGQAYYLAEVALYHFERQSMAGHPSQSDSGSTEFNRALHHHRWSDRISAAMSDARYQGGADASR